MYSRHSRHPFSSSTSHRARFAVMVLCLGALSVAGAVAHAAPSTPFPFPDYSTVDYTQVPIQETGVVDVVADGDTFRFIEDGSSSYVTVRLLGINTPEVRGFYNKNRDEDMCGAVAATGVLASLLPPGTPVQLRSLSKESAGLNYRPQRYAFAWNPATSQYDIDVQAELASAGLATLFTLSNEAALSYSYAVHVANAQAAGRGIWNPRFCGPPEQPDASISLIAHWNAGRNDNANPNGEYVIVRNTGGTVVDLSGWILRDSGSTAWFIFPNGSVLTPDDYRVVHVGQGTPGSPEPRDLYVGSTTALLANVARDRFTGDGVYLLDPSTAFRSWFDWPCVVDCMDPPKESSRSPTSTPSSRQRSHRGQPTRNTSSSRTPRSRRSTSMATTWHTRAPPTRSSSTRGSRPGRR